MNNCRLAGPQAARVFDGGRFQAFDSTIVGQEFAIQVGSTGEPGTKGIIQLHDCRVFVTEGSTTPADAIAIDFIDGVGLLWACHVTANGGSSSNTACKISAADLFFAQGCIFSATDDSVINTAIETNSASPRIFGSELRASGDSATNTALRIVSGQPELFGAKISASGSSGTNKAIETSSASPRIFSSSLTASGDSSTNTAVRVVSGQPELFGARISATGSPDPNTGIEIVEGEANVVSANVQASGDSTTNTGIRVAGGEPDFFALEVKVTGSSGTNTGIDADGGLVDLVSAKIIAQGDAATNTGLKATDGAEVSLAGGIAAAVGGSTAANIGVDTADANTNVLLTGGALAAGLGGATNLGLRQQSGSELRVATAIFDPAAVTGTVSPGPGIFILRDLNDADPATNIPAGQVGEVAYNSDNSSSNAGFWGRGASTWVQLG